MNNLPLLDDLKLFCTVARKRSFVATANELGFSPAYVSKRIALLEKNLNVQLLYRTTRQVSVTEEGESVYEWSQRIIEDVEQMAASVASASRLPKGTLRVATSPGFGLKRLAPALSQLVSRYSELHVQIELLDRPVDLIAEGFDLDIRIGGSVEANLIVKRIARNHRVLCASPDYLARFGIPDNLPQLRHHRCLIIRERDQTFGIWRLEGPNGTETVRVNYPMSCNNGAIVHQWALDGHGIVLRSLWDVRESIASGSLVHLLPVYYQEADITAVYPIRLTQSAKIRVCVEFLEQQLAKQPISG